MRSATSLTVLRGANIVPAAFGRSPHRLNVLRVGDAVASSLLAKEAHMLWRLASELRARRGGGAKSKALASESDEWLVDDIKIIGLHTDSKTMRARVSSLVANL